MALVYTRGAKLMFSAFEDGGEMWTGQGAREARTRVVFLEPFLSPPVVHVGIGMWDMGGDTNQRAERRPRQRLRLDPLGPWDQRAGKGPGRAGIDAQ